MVVGDRKQLPPTSFFSRLLADESLDDEDELVDTAPLAGAARATEPESVARLMSASRPVSDAVHLIIASFEGPI